jgi:hypothetical protein
METQPEAVVSRRKILELLSFTQNETESNFNAFQGLVRQPRAVKHS